MSEKPQKIKTFTEGEIGWMIKALKAGLPITRIAKALSSSYTTVRRWIDENPDVWEARLDEELVTWQSLSKDGGWRAKAWVLSRIDPGAYADAESVKRALTELAEEHNIPLDQLAARFEEINRDTEEPS